MIQIREPCGEYDVDVNSSGEPDGPREEKEAEMVHVTNDGDTETVYVPSKSSLKKILKKQKMVNMF